MYAGGGKGSGTVSRTYRPGGEYGGRGMGSVAELSETRSVTKTGTERGGACWRMRTLWRFLRRLRCTRTAISTIRSKNTAANTAMTTYELEDSDADDDEDESATRE